MRSESEIRAACRAILAECRKASERGDEKLADALADYGSALTWAIGEADSEFMDLVNDIQRRAGNIPIPLVISALVN